MSNLIALYVLYGFLFSNQVYIGDSQIHKLSQYFICVINFMLDTLSFRIFFRLLRHS